MDTRSVTFSSGRGMTLIEVLIVVAIIGIIASIGWPAFNREIALNKRKEGIQALTAASNVMEKCRTDKGSYTTCGASVNNTQSPKGHYKITVSITNNGESYTLSARNNATDYDTNCETLTLNNLGQKGAEDTGNTPVSVQTAHSCWGD